MRDGLKRGLDMGRDGCKCGLGVVRCGCEGGLVLLLGRFKCGLGTMYGMVLSVVLHGNR